MLLDNTQFTDMSDGGILITQSENLGSVLKDNKEKRENGVMDDMKLAASIPLIVLEHWRTHEGLDYNLVGSCPDTTARFWRKLQDREWEKFRIWGGKIV